MSDPVKTKAERYGSASVAGRLRLVDDRRTDLDTIAAAGMSGQHEPTGMTIWRGKYANDAHSYKAGLELVQAKVRNIARRKHWREPAGEVRALVVTVYRWWVFGVCPSCEGRGLLPVAGVERVLSDDPCPACHGEGRTPIEAAVPVHVIGRAKDVAQVLEVVERRAEGLMREKLSNDPLQGHRARVQSAQAATTCTGENRSTITTGAAFGAVPSRPEKTR